MPFTIPQEDQKILESLHPSYPSTHENSHKTVLEVLNKIPEEPGLYAFWWTGDKELLESLNRKISFQGKESNDGKITKGERNYLKLDYQWKLNDEMPQCLYVGKTTNLRNRIKQHLLTTGTKEGKYANWEDESIKTMARAMEAIVRNREAKDGFRFMVKHTTACQFRAGMEFLFWNTSEYYPSILDNTIVCYHTMDSLTYDSEIDGMNMVQRFYLEDLAIGIFKPWFNLDSER